MISDENTNNSLKFIEQFLTDIGCLQYVSDFVKFQITEPDTLCHIDKDILLAIGVTKLGHRMKIMRQVKLLVQSRQKEREKVNMDELVKVIDKFSQLGTNSFNNGGEIGTHLANNMLIQGGETGNGYSTALTSGNTTYNYNSASISNMEDFFTEKHHVIFILNDGSAKKVNVNGCFNSNSIKKRLVKRLPKELQVSKDNKDSSDNASTSSSSIASDYDVFVVDYMKNVLHLLYDVELVTICHSNDRWERNRLIFVSRDQTPSDIAILTSKKIYMKTLVLMNRMQESKRKQQQLQQQQQSQRKQLQEHQQQQQQRYDHSHNNPDPTYDDQISEQSSQLRIDNTKDKIRKVFNQRPPSEFITTNLSGYFPDANVRKLEKTLRHSYRQSIRLSTVGTGLQRVLSAGSNNVGDILLKHSNDVDRALLQDLQRDTNNRTHNASSHQKAKVYFRNSNGEDEENEEDNVNDSANEDSDDQLYDENEYDDVDADIVSLPTKMITPKSWLKGARIGSGSFGSVYLGMNAQTGELMAVKQVAIQQPPVIDTLNASSRNDKEMIKLKNESNMYRKMVESLQHEMNLLKELHHENIVTYYGSSQEGGNLNIFLEYVPGGSVSSMLNNYGPFEESLIINFTRQILIGVAYLHKKNIIHRDIKGANILIDIRGSVKITDFGISKKLSPLNKNKEDDDYDGDGDQSGNKENKRASLQGSVYWMAPEVVKQTATTEKVDIWSTGCVVIEMFTGKHPYPDFSQMQAIFKIGTNKGPEIPSWASREAKSFLRQTFELDYHRRPSAIELLQHPWLDTHLLS